MTSKYDHAAKGNPTAATTGRSFAYDFDNQLSTATISPGSTQGTPGTHTYTYDAMGRRVSKTTNGTTTVFVCSNGQVLAEYTAGAASTTPDRKYIYGNYIDEPIALIDATSSAEETYYYHRNRQYSIIGLTNQTGQVVERYSYTAYGDPTILAPDGVTIRTTSNYSNEYMHTGRRFEVEIGLYYYRARYYSPTLGQFLQRDPLGYPDGLNTYAAYHVMRGGVDPWGLECIKPTAPTPRDCSAIYDKCVDNADAWLKNKRKEIVKEAEDLFDKLNKEQEKQFNAVVNELERIRDDAIAECQPNSNDSWIDRALKFACREGARAGFQGQRAAAWAAYKAALYSIKGVVLAYKTGEFTSASIEHRILINECKANLKICLENNEKNHNDYLDKLKEYRKCCKENGIEP